jgi:DNA adenine methylase
MPIKYVGGKEKYAAEILALILPGNEHRPYYEPFVGSASMLVAVPPTMRRFANDRNPYLIAMHEAVRDGWVPPTEITEEQYSAIRRSPDKFSPELVAFVSIACSFGGKMWGGYARGKTNKGLERNYAAEGSRAIMETREALQGVTFTSGNFTDLVIPDGALVYCDPPYQGTTDYGAYTVNSFGELKTWCNKLSQRGCEVFISGYKQNKLTGWDIVWSTEVLTSLSKHRAEKATSRNTRVECLFRPNLEAQGLLAA